MSVRDRILSSLDSVGFEIGIGTIAPLGRELPLVEAWALDHDTATLALIASDPRLDGDPAELDRRDEQWRELLFAVASLRHEVRRGRAPALSTPIVLALVNDGEGESRLRSLAESLSREFLLFSRVELNLVVGEPPDRELELALAPLLIQSRRALMRGNVIGSQTLEDLAAEVAASVEARVEEIDKALRPQAPAAARRIVEHLQRAIVPSSELAGAHDFRPLESIRLRNFRAFEEAEIPLAQATLFEGLNGTGKSSVIEALQILLSGTSDRRPADVSRADFDDHLRRNGTEEWSIEALVPGHPSDPVKSTSESPRENLRRNIFLQDLSRDIALESPSHRYTALLRITGLEIPELRELASDLRATTRDDLNRVLRKLGVDSLSNLQLVGPRYVREKLRVIGKTTLPPLSVVSAAEAQLIDGAKAHGVALSPRFMDEDELAQAWQRLESVVARQVDLLRPSDEVVGAAREFHNALRDHASRARKQIKAIDEVLARVPRRLPVATEATKPSRRQETAIPPAAAQEWLDAGAALRRASIALRSRRESITDPVWTDRVDRFLDAANNALEAVPFEFLEAAVSQASAAPLPRQRPSAPTVDSSALADAGLPTDLLPFLSDVEGPLIGLRDAIRSRAASAEALAEEVLQLPLVNLEGAEDELHEALAAYEIARRIQVPLERAQEVMLTRLFETSLRTVLAELVAALTRFEWYFGRFEVDVEKQAVAFRKMVVDSDALDLRMLLNAGERSIVTIAWFLALHLLQPPARRRVLVMDDPLAALDANNAQAAIATLRTIARLTKPDLFLFSTHDLATAESVERELQPVGEWPARTSRLHFSRDSRGLTRAEAADAALAEPDVEDELERLGLRSTPTATSNAAVHERL